MSEGADNTAAAPATTPEAPAKPTKKKRAARLLRPRPPTLALAAVVAAAVGVGLANLIVIRAGDPWTYDEVPAVPARTTAVVFGAYTGPSRQPSGVLSDRIRYAVALYQAGKVQHLLMTGDNSNPDFDEVSVMKDAAVALGVPASDVTRDYAGFDTYDSCARAKKVFGVTDAVLVTQDFHLARALYLCRAQGIDAVGLAVPDWQHLPERAGTSYPPDLQRDFTVREWLARTKAFVEGRIVRPDPKMGGPYQGLNGN